MSQINSNETENKFSRSWLPGSRSLSVDEYHHWLGWLVHSGLGY
jgi:hypothetical protein